MTDEKNTEMITLVDEAPMAGAPFAVTTKDEAMRMAQFLAKSSLIPKPLQGNASDVLIVMMGAEDLSITPFRALQSFAVIQGRLTMSAELMRALVARSPVCEYLMQTEATETQATFETKRQGHPEPTSYTYTLNDAKVASLLSKDNWKKHPREMLLARASSGLCRQVYPDLLAGIVYTPEEAAEGVAEVKDVTPVVVDGDKADKLAANLGYIPEEHQVPEEELEKYRVEPEPVTVPAEVEREPMSPDEVPDEATEALDEAIKPGEPEKEPLIELADIKAIKAAMGTEMSMEELELFLSGRYGTRVLATLPHTAMDDIMRWIATNVAQSSLLEK